VAGDRCSIKAIKHQKKNGGWDRASRSPELPGYPTPFAFWIPASKHHRNRSGLTQAHRINLPSTRSGHEECWTTNKQPENRYCCCRESPHHCCCEWRSGNS
jgi:hypothetical protein